MHAKKRIGATHEPAGSEAGVSPANPPTRACGGFSLLELLVTLALILALFVMYYSAGSQSRQAKLKAHCQQNLQYICVALQTYARENQDQFPALPNARTAAPPLSLLVPRYTTVTAHFICPGSGDSALAEAQPFAKRKISYAYYMGQGTSAEASQPLMSDAQVNTLAKTNGQPLFSADGKAPGNNHHKYGGNVMFCDGHIAMSPAKAAWDLVPNDKIILLNPKP
jgi:prepilin-type N-terminal cleavage/methylation domain-containing protein/prepilin-type processing-associated H-X9-DG protein